MELPKGNEKTVLKGAAKRKQKAPTRSILPEEIRPKKLFKGLKAIARRVPSGRVSFLGSFLTEGDIVSVVDATDRKLYYAQIRGLLQDQFCEKYAVITWLIPTKGSPKGRFDPGTYIYGPEEDIPREIDCFRFVCHPPNEYYRMKKNPTSSLLPIRPELGYLISDKGNKIVALPYVDSSSDDD